MTRAIGYNRLHAENNRQSIGYNRLHAENNQLQSVTCQERSVTIGYMTRTIGDNRLQDNRLQSVTIGYMPRTIGYNRLHDEDNR